jgi:hypothetical protein
MCEAALHPAHIFQVKTATGQNSFRSQNVRNWPQGRWFSGGMDPKK